MRILIVEDHADLRNGLEQALEEEGYAVDLAADGSEGLYKAETWEYDAIVLDWMLPEMDGLELLKRLRKSKPTPVLFLTARDTLQERVTGLDHGADDYLVKPFELQELTARLRALIRRSAGEPDPRIEIGPIVVDTSAQVVSLSGVPIEMTAREYRLTELFAMNRGKLVTRTMIYDHLFDEEHDSMSNLVDVYISRLRSKLGRDFLKTRRGEGYLLETPETNHSEN